MLLGAAVRLDGQKCWRLTQIYLVQMRLFKDTCNALFATLLKQAAKPEAARRMRSKAQTSRLSFCGCVCLTSRHILRFEKLLGGRPAALTGLRR